MVWTRRKASSNSSAPEAASAVYHPVELATTTTTSWSPAMRSASSRPHRKVSGEAFAERRWTAGSKPGARSRSESGVRPARAQLVGATDPRVRRRQRPERGGSVRARAGKATAARLTSAPRPAASPPAHGRRGGHDLVDPDQHGGRGRSERHERVDGANGAQRRPMRCSARSATIASATPPPVARHSSTTSTVPTSVACARIASVGSGFSHRRSRTRARRSWSSREALRGLEAQAQAVGVADEEEVGVPYRRAVEARPRPAGASPAAADSRTASRRRPRRGGPSRGRARSARGR